MTADFSTWKPDNLARFAKDAQAKLIEQANANARVLTVLKGLMSEYERVADLYCFVPERHDAYRVAREVFK